MLNTTANANIKTGRTDIKDAVAALSPIYFETIIILVV
jgi:hypothetical protein